MKFKITLLLSTFLLFASNLKAQSSNESFLFKNYGVGVGANISAAPGFRIDAATTINNRFNLRVGASFLSFNRANSIMEIVDDVFDDKVSQYLEKNIIEPYIIGDSKISAFNGHLMLDFTPVKNGVFHLTAGLFFGNTDIFASGSIVDHKTGKNIVDMMKANGFNKELPELSRHGLLVKFNDNGSADARVHIGKNLKPYFGIGLGRTIPNSRVGFKAEIGFLYIGESSITSPNLLTNDRKPFDRQPVNSYLADNWDEYSNYKSGINFSPLASLQLTIRLN